MKVSEVSPNDVFLMMGSGMHVVCVDFQRGDYVDLNNVTVQMVQKYLSEDTSKFFSVE